MALCLAFLFITLSSNSQTVDPTTGNLITGNWSGTVPATGYNGYSGGDTPGYIATQKAIVFGYSQGTVSQSISVANALANAGTGIEVKGYNYSWYYYNNDANKGNLSGTIALKGAAGNVLESYNYNMPQLGIGNWIQQSGSQTFTNQYQISQLSTLDVSFTGKDDKFWAGYYGPAIKSINVNLAYGVNPCATNPAYSPNCPGFSDVTTSNNLVPRPGDYAYGGYSINQSYAINTALASAGSAAQIHGFQWGYVANANGPYCNSWDMGLLGCWDFRAPWVTTNVNITNSAGASLYNVSREYQNSYNTTSYSHLFPSSQTMSTLGNFNFTASTNDQAYIGSMWSRALYTVDPCVANPLYSPTCSGYGAAFAKTLMTSTTTSTTAAYTGTTSVTAPSQVETSPAGVIDQTSPATVQQSSSSTSTASSSSSTTAAAQESTQTAAAPTADPAQPASTTPTPAGGPAQTTATASSSSSSSSAGGGGGAGPSKLAMSVLKSAQEKDKATQTAAVASAAKTLENATQSSQASSNSAISMNQDMSANSAVAAATFASQTTQASQQTAVQPGQQQQSMQAQTQQTTRVTQQVQQVQQDTQQTQTVTYGNSTQVQQAMYTPPAQQQQDTQVNATSMLKPPTSFTVESTQQASSGTGLTVTRNPFAYNPLSAMNSSNASIMPTAPPPVYQFRTETKSTEVEAPQVQVASFGGPGKAGNPLSEMMQQKFEMMQDNITQPTSSVNRNVQPNDLAGKVDLTAMAVVPAGFTAYSFVLRDAAFYEPKEVYKNQKTVDNVRLLRGLTGGSDALHQRMVDSQYK